MVSSVDNLTLSIQEVWFEGRAYQKTNLQAYIVNLETRHRLKSSTIDLSSINIKWFISPLPLVLWEQFID